MSTRSIICYGLAMLVAPGLLVDADGDDDTDLLRMRRHSFMDTRGMAMEACRVLVPESWRVEGGISWNLNRMPPESAIAWRLVSPDQRCVVEQFPHMNLFWSQDQLLCQSHMQMGSRINPPMPAGDFIRQFLVNQLRPQASGLKVLDSGQLPQLANETREITQYHLQVYNSISPMRFPFNVNGDAARAKIRYSLQGTEWIEEITVSISYVYSLLPSMYGQTQACSWIPIAYSFRAPAGTFEEMLPLFRTITASRRENPAWATACTRFTASLTRRELANRQAIFDRMQQIRRSQSEVDDIIMDTYNRRNAAYDRIFDNYSQAVRGVDAYTDPVNHERVELPTGYPNAWTDGSSYVFSEDAGFDPNVELDGNWQQMQRIGE